MRHVTRLAVALCIGAMTAASFVTLALAQAVPPSATPAPQNIPGYEAKGIPVSGFRLFPTLSLGYDYDDNVYRSDSNPKADNYFVQTPAFQLLSQWGRHELDLYGSVSTYEYTDFDNEDHTDDMIGTSGRVDIYRGIDIIGSSSYANLHEARNSPDQYGFARKPTAYALTRANVAFEYRPYQFHVTVGGTYAHYNYDETQLIGLPQLNNGDRNRDEYEYYARAAYEFSPGYAAFLEVGGRDVHYNLALDRNGLRRDNHGYDVNAGLNIVLTRLVEGKIFAGYLNETYKNPLPDISGFNYGANLDWYASPLWTFHLTASRVLNGTTINAASAEDDQSVRVSADFNPQPNLIFNGYVGYLDENFNGSPRDDRYTTAGLSLRYLLNHNFNLQGGYDYEKRDSTITGQDFDDNHLFVGLNFQL